ncbi:MAG: regulatory protein RecX [Solirubrobacteraceae bacterium]
MSEEALADALGRAYRYLGHRDRTVAELRTYLIGKDVAEEIADGAIDELVELGYVDDARFARQFAEDKRNLDAWGSDRIERRLRELGVDRSLIAAALAALDEADGPTEVEVAVELLRRRFPAPPETARDRERALGLLVRRGYDLELAYDAIRAHGREAA